MYKINFLLRYSLFHIITYEVVIYNEIIRGDDQMKIINVFESDKLKGKKYNNLVEGNVI